jgi:hypothetical protein
MLVHHNLNDEKGESPKWSHEKDYVMRLQGGGQQTGYQISGDS